MVSILRYTANELDTRSFARFETEFAYLGFSHFQAIAPLRPWVQRYFHLRVATDLPQKIEQAFYPDGGTSLHFYLPTNTSQSYDSPQVFFHCAQHRHSQIFIPGTEHMTVRFHPGGAFHLLGIGWQDMPPSAVLDATQLSLTGLESLLAQLTALQQPALRIALLEQWLFQRIAPRLDTLLLTRRGLVQASLPTLIQPQANLDDFYGQLPISRRQFERRFKQETGLSPARLLQLSRVKIARNLLSQSPSLSLAQVASDSGFYDQAHLHQHFLHVMQQTPGQYKKRKMSQISNLDPR